jgi:hypothetical protein
LVVANNVFEHVPDVDFSRGLRAMMADTGYVSIEDPAPAEADRWPGSRHHLPRALLVLDGLDH